MNYSIMKMSVFVVMADISSDNVNWHIEEGEHWALLGLNGAGKSTLLSMIPAYQIPTTGTLRVFGHEFGKYVWPKIKSR